MEGPSIDEYRPEHPDIRADFIIPQAWENYTDVEHGVWKTLYERQMDLLPGRACNEFLDGLKALKMPEDKIPNFDEMNEHLMKLTGWQVVAVPGLVPDSIFFEHLANRRFVSGNFIRKPDQLDYLQEPDIFHDVFGHVPLLANPIFADYMEAYGKGGLRAMEHHCLQNLSRLYWYTVEFGLIKTPEGMRIYGAGILSSKGESIFSLDSDSPNRIHFDLPRLMRTKYRIDDYQQTYWVIDSFEELFAETAAKDFGPIYEELPDLGSYEPWDVLAKDKVYTQGTQEYAKSKGRMPVHAA